MGRHGADVALLDRERAAAAETQELLSAEGGPSVVIVCDVSDPGRVRRPSPRLRPDSAASTCS